MRHQQEPAPPAATETETKGDGGDGGVWVGIDWGTTNSAVGVYDRTRGGSKWIRLSTSLAGHDQKRPEKPGRLLPTVLLVATRQHVSQHYDPSSSSSHRQSTTKKKSNFYHGEWQDLATATADQTSPATDLLVLLGAAALQLVDAAEAPPGDDDEKNVWTEAMISSTKRKILTGGAESISIIPAGMTVPIDIPCHDIVTIFIRSLRLAATSYLQRYGRIKHLDVPIMAAAGAASSSSSSSSVDVEVSHCCIGIPAAATMAYKSMIRAAALGAGFRTVKLITESTAAAMAYGLTLQQPDLTKIDSKPYNTIMVCDIGGGTTDITIARRRKQRRNNNNADPAKTTGGDDDDDANNNIDHDDDDDDDDVGYKVLKSIGDNALGGDDMDEALRCFCHAPVTALRQMRNAKVELCSSNNNNNNDDKKVYLSWGGKKRKESVTVSVTDFETAIRPILDRLRRLVTGVIVSIGDVDIDEVILVGGTTRVPAVQRTLQQVFPAIELCRSVQPDSAVALGCAIAAALEVLPRHELQSAYMMDTNPHPIGVYTTTATTTTMAKKSGDDVNEGSFIEILAAGAPLPAKGSASFTLADPKQPGVSLRAVERIGDGRYETVGEFTFLLRRLDPRTLPAVRSVEISMLLKESGEFIVGIFDEYDPEHLNKRRKNHQCGGGGGDLQHFINDPGSWEQTMLIVGCISLFVLYIAVRLAFPPDDLGLEK